jgi:DNA polymerase V
VSQLPVVAGFLEDLRVSSSVEQVYRPILGRPLPRPLFSSRVQAGFPSPADDHVAGELDLHKLLVKREAATFYVRVRGDSMTGAGIHEGDILVVDRSIEPAHGRIVIAVVDGELTVKELAMGPEGIRLLPRNAAYPPLVLQGESELVVWGVVTAVVRQL